MFNDFGVGVIFRFEIIKILLLLQARFFKMPETVAFSQRRLLFLEKTHLVGDKNL